MSSANRIVFRRYGKIDETSFMARKNRTTLSGKTCGTPSSRMGIEENMVRYASCVQHTRMCHMRSKSEVFSLVRVSTFFLK